MIPPSVVIEHPGALYWLDPGTGMYQRTDPADENAIDILLGKITIGEDETGKLLQDVKILGTEALDGREATVIGLVGKGTDGEILTKLWVWNQKGLYLKTETLSPDEPSASETMEWRNFVFEEIADAVFDVPEDKIIK
jgi:hypothetical protein